MKLVSLCPSITETLVALGLGDALAGVTRYCVHPAGALRGVPRVGGTKNPDVARILGLAPDLVLANAEENRRQDVETLAERLRVDVSHPRTVAEVPGLVRRFGRLTGREGAAEELAAGIEARIQELARQAWPPFRFAYLIWKRPFMAAAAGTYISDLLGVVGGRNVFGGEAPYPEVGADGVLAAAPDVVLLPDEPYRFREEDRREWEERLAGQSRVLAVAGDDYCWHGVRTLRGLDAVAALARDLART